MLDQLLPLQEENKLIYGLAVHGGGIERRCLSELNPRGIDSLVYQLVFKGVLVPAVLDLRLDIDEGEVSFHDLRPERVF